MSMSTTSPALAILETIIDEIEGRVAEHDGDLTSEEREYVAGLTDALNIVRGKADRLR